MNTRKPLPLPKTSSCMLQEDLDLFQKIAKGEYAALEVLFNKYYQALCRFGLSYQKDISIVEERVSDVFILLWNKRKELHQIEKPKSYIYVIAKNSLKKSTKSNTVFSIDANYQSNILFAPSTEEEIIDKEQKAINAQIIQSILSSIPKKSRQIFELSRIDGFKYREISEIMGLSPRTVENHIALAMKYISKGLRDLQ